MRVRGSVASCPLIDKSYKINRRIVFVFRLLGLGINGLSSFCGMMNICSGMTTTIYYAYVENIRIATKSAYNIVLKRCSRREERKRFSRTPGRSFHRFRRWLVEKERVLSLIGVTLTSIIEYHTKKVVDAMVISKFWQSCSVWEEKMKILLVTINGRKHTWKLAP